MSLNQKQKDVLTEIINIGIGKGAALLNEMLSKRIDLSIPWVKVVNKEQVKQYLALGNTQVSKVDLAFEGDFSGIAELLFPTKEAAKLVSIITGEADDAELDVLRAGTLSEVGNIVLNGVMGSLGNVLHKTLHYQIPNYLEGNFKDIQKIYLKESTSDSLMIFCRADFLVKELSLSGNILLLFNVNSFENLIDAINKLIDA